MTKHRHGWIILSPHGSPDYGMTLVHMLQLTHSLVVRHLARRRAVHSCLIKRWQTMQFLMVTRPMVLLKFPVSSLYSLMTKLMVYGRYDVMPAREQALIP